MIEIFSSDDLPSDARIPEKEFLAEGDIYPILVQEHGKWKKYVSDKQDRYPEALYVYDVEKLHSEIMEHLFKICKSNREHYKKKYTINDCLADLRLNRIDRFKRILWFKFRSLNLDFGACEMLYS